MSPTGIEWVLNPDVTRGITVNSKTGCVNHTAEGLCLGGLFPCYAFGLAHKRLKQRYLGNPNVANYADQAKEKVDQLFDPFYPRFWPERLDKIRRIKKPTGIFLDDMSDWMWAGWPEEQTCQELQVMRDCPQHRFYTLTKQPQRLPEFSPFPDNAWVGVTATNQTMAFRGLSQFLQIEAPVKYLSLEPLLGRMPELTDYCLVQAGISWLIIGACTGSYLEMMKLHLKTDIPIVNVMKWGNKWTLQPRIEWLQEVVEAADKAGVKVLEKDNLMPLLQRKLRQELPQ